MILSFVSSSSGEINHQLKMRLVHWSGTFINYNLLRIALMLYAMQESGIRHFS